MLILSPIHIIIILVICCHWNDLLQISGKLSGTPESRRISHIIIRLNDEYETLKDSFTIVACGFLLVNMPNNSWRSATIP